MLVCVIISELPPPLAVPLRAEGICVNACMFVPVCLTFPLCFFLFMIGGVSAKLLLIHHPAATGLSCDWTRRTLPPAKMICRPKLDSYRL